MSEQRFINGQLREWWNDDTRVYTAWDAGGAQTEQRPYTAEENARADADAANRATQAASAQQLADLSAAVANITSIRDAAQADIATANNLKGQADAISAQLATQSTQVGAWVPTTTTTSVKNDFITVRNQVKDLTDRVKQLTDAASGQYAYRAANDNAVVTIYNAVLWLARQVSGRITD